MSQIYLTVLASILKTEIEEKGWESLVDSLCSFHIVVHIVFLVVGHSPKGLEKLCAKQSLLLPTLLGANSLSLRRPPFLSVMNSIRLALINA